MLLRSSLAFTSFALATTLSLRPSQAEHDSLMAGYSRSFLLSAFGLKSKAHRCRFSALHIVATRSVMAVNNTKASTTVVGNIAVVRDADGCNSVAYQLDY